MDYQTRRNIKRTEEMGVKVTTLPIEETGRFFKLFKMVKKNTDFLSVMSLTLKNYKRPIKVMHFTTCIYRFK